MLATAIKVTWQGSQQGFVKSPFVVPQFTFFSVCIQLQLCKVDNFIVKLPQF
jgi:hypothetical protein